MGGGVLPIGGWIYQGPVLSLFLIFCIGGAESDARTSLQRCKECGHHARSHPHCCTIQLVAIFGAESSYSIHCNPLISQQQTRRTRLGIHFNRPLNTYRIRLQPLPPLKSSMWIYPVALATRRIRLFPDDRTILNYVIPLLNSSPSLVEPTPIVRFNPCTKFSSLKIALCC